MPCPSVYCAHHSLSLGQITVSFSALTQMIFSMDAKLLLYISVLEKKKEYIYVYVKKRDGIMNPTTD